MGLSSVLMLDGETAFEPSLDLGGASQRHAIYVRHYPKGTRVGETVLTIIGTPAELSALRDALGALIIDMTAAKAANTAEQEGGNADR